VVQQLREAFPEAGPYRYVILDRDSKFDHEVITFLKSTGLQPKRTSVRAPWQNGIAERWVGSCRREPGPRHRTERTTSPPANPRLREVSSRRSHSRFPTEGHSKQAASRATAIC
jgi:transposase InsO family protein